MISIPFKNTTTRRFFRKEFPLLNRYMSARIGSHGFKRELNSLKFILAPISDPSYILPRHHQISSRARL
ncbi:hypothetical protein EMIT0P2_100104 [Pseudomonas sp. IT-P2]